MVLHGILEYFLHGTGASWGIDDATVGQREDAVFADAVLEKLGNMGGKGRRRLMTIEPGGNTQTDILLLGIAVHHVECRL